LRRLFCFAAQDRARQTKRRLAEFGGAIMLNVLNEMRMKETWCASCRLSPARDA